MTPHDAANLFDDAVLFLVPGGANQVSRSLNVPPRAFSEVIEAAASSLRHLCGRVLRLQGTRVPCRQRWRDLRLTRTELVNAVAVGSLPQLTGGVAYDATPRSAVAAEIRTTDLLTAAPVTLYAHYHGGCRFDFGDATSPAAQILAVYTGMAGTPPAIVSSGVGRGSAILTGVHLEMSERECKDACCGYIRDMACTRQTILANQAAETETARGSRRSVVRSHSPTTVLTFQ